MEMDIIKHIKDLMDERGWTNYRLGKEAGLSQSTITNLFNRNNAPTIPTLEAVCRAFGITLSQFFSEGNTPAELTEEQRTLFAAWSTLNDGQKEARRLCYLPRTCGLRFFAAMPPSTYPPEPPPAYDPGK